VSKKLSEAVADVAVEVVAGIFDADHYAAIIEQNEHVMVAMQKYERDKAKASESKKIRDELVEGLTSLIGTKQAAPLFDQAKTGEDEA